jgi:hypothetical protein
MGYRWRVFAVISPVLWLTGAALAAAMLVLLFRSVFSREGRDRRRRSRSYRRVARKGSGLSVRFSVRTPKDKGGQ